MYVEQLEVDISQKALAMAKSFGADHCVDASKDDVVERIAAATEGYKAKWPKTKILSLWVSQEQRPNDGRKQKVAKMSKNATAGQATFERILLRFYRWIQIILHNRCIV